MANPVDNCGYLGFPIVFFFIGNVEFFLVFFVTQKTYQFINFPWTRKTVILNKDPVCEDDPMMASYGIICYQ